MFLFKFVRSINIHKVPRESVPTNGLVVCNNGLVLCPYVDLNLRYRNI